MTLSNYSLGEADILRRAMGKKIGSLMDAQRDRFVAGAVENGIEPAKADRVFGLMAKFAEYGFNKSHSAAYALIAYQTAWLKSHYPVEFMAALMNSFLSSSDQIVRLINQCAQMEIGILPPDVNESDTAFKVVERMIRFGLGAVKNVGEAAVEVILQGRRDDGPFLSLHDFCERIDSQKVNRRVVEQLIRCGAFDSVHANRAQLMAGLDEVLDRAAAVQKDRQAGQLNLFEMLRSQKKMKAPALPAISDWDSRLRLQFEKESLGFYISGHPLDFYSEQIKSMCSDDTQSVKDRVEGADVVLCGIFSIIKEITTKRGDRMAFLNLEDKAGTIEVVAFAEPFTQARALIEGDAPLSIWARVQHDEKSTKLLANRILSMEDAALVSVDSVFIKLDAAKIDRDALTQLRSLLISNPGICPALLHLRMPGNGEAVLALNKLPVNPTPSFFEQLRARFGPDCAKPVYKKQ